uniref:Uncharacterized protein n=1 Tax=Klebsiella pneumoniae TaxID=573 RepID=A0A6G7SNA8_KLEPN|nr:hypothetical protein [Klebsiella pneumoniae]QUW42259.1 hypothetical protein [Escherichia coli]QIS32937.1 hypothetical protein [Klebsiella pneumoniae]QUW41268.1 hypothetical protein [Klebsiella pneumoniae]QUW41531.1 hypothetical protein [Klebsiella pneumoniae]
MRGRRRFDKRSASENHILNGKTGKIQRYIYREKLHTFHTR